jgi:hypothetical protein
MAAPLSLRSQIAQAVLDRLDLVGEYNYIGGDKVRLQSSDFQDYELPACQIIDLGNPATHERSRAKRLWTLAIEIIMGPTSTEEPTQKKLWDLVEYTENTLFAVPNLGIPGVIHMHLIDSYTDLHIMGPFYTARIEIEVEFYQPLVAPC